VNYRTENDDFDEKRRIEAEAIKKIIKKKDIR
jgi:hypothetical protein